MTKLQNVSENHQHKRHGKDMGMGHIHEEGKAFSNLSPKKLIFPGPQIVGPDLFGEEKTPENILQPTEQEGQKGRQKVEDQNAPKTRREVPKFFRAFVEIVH
jgi:hypothetical protein